MILDVKNLSKTFTVHTRDGIEVDGFRDISFTLQRGEFLALSGPSGAGKSSILKTLFRTYKTTSGQILFRPRQGGIVDIASVNDSEMLQIRKDELGYVSQFLQILPRITAVEAVSAPLIEKGESVESAHEKAKTLLDYFSIREELFQLSPLTFSGGEQQRVNIAKGIIAPKALLLLDEPTASLDKVNTLKVIDKLQAIKAQGVAMVGIFHDQEAMDLISDSVFKVQRLN